MNKGDSVEQGVGDLLNEEQVEFIRSQRDFIDREAERRIAAIHAVRNAETQSLLAYRRLLRSKMTDGQLKTPATEFFKENFPNLSVVRNKKYPFLELQGKDDGDGGEMLSFSELTKSAKQNIQNASKGGF